MAATDHASLAHELRTPMAVVLGTAETLLTSDEALTAEKQRRLLTSLYVNAEVLRSRIEEQVLGGSS